MRKLTLSIFALCLVLVSCDLTGLNQNEKEPTDVPADPLFSNAQATYGSFVHETDVNDGIFKLMSQWWTTTTYTSEARYNIPGRSISEAIWNEFYRDMLIDLKDAKSKVKANETLSTAVKNNKLASIEVMSVLAYSKLVNIFGNVPYSEALNFENPQPKYDDAKTIWTDLMNRLDTAIGMFNPSAEGFGSADLFYGGDISKWVKFANSLKMRMAMVIADVNPAAAEAAFLEAAPNAISSNAENAMIPFTTAPPHTNPVWEALVQSGRNDYVPAAPLIDRMKTVNDPRLAVFFTKTGGGEYIGGVYGMSNDYTAFSHFTPLIKEAGRDGVLLGYAEVQFLMAEAAARGWAVSGTAAEYYENGIRADLSFWGVPEADIDAYLAQSSVAYATAEGDWRQKIGTQKWYGLFLQGIQGWTVHRRLGYPQLEAPADAYKGITDVPSRFTYPASEATFNGESYKAASSAIGGDLLTTELWWDVN